MIKEIKGEDFRKMQLTELDMLVEFDKVCRKYNINYVLFGGSLLGGKYMIIRCQKEDEKIIESYIGTEYYKCLYLYMNLQRYGTGSQCTSLIHRWDTKTSFTTHFFGKIQYVGIK